MAVIDCFFLLDLLFSEVKISEAECFEISLHPTKPFHERICTYFKDKVHFVEANNLTLDPSQMDKAEAGSLVLYQSLGADFLLIDDNK